MGPVPIGTSPEWDQSRLGRGPPGRRPVALAGCSVIPFMSSLINSAPGLVPALVEFRGFAALPTHGPSRALVVWIASRGSPHHMAQWFASALALDPSPERFAVSCLARDAPSWRPLGPSTAGVERLRAVVGSYHYRLALGGRGRTALGVQCWRCYPQGLGWQRRCGPMALQAFIHHFGGRGTASGQPRRPFRLRSEEPSGARALAG